MSTNRNNWYRKTEKMLYIYPLVETLIKDESRFNDNGLTSNYSFESCNCVSSPAKKKGYHQLELILEMTLRRWNIRTLRCWKEVVEISIDVMLSPEQYDLVQLIYWKRIPLEKICEEKAINKNTLSKQRRDIMNLLAWCFGFLKNEDALKKIQGLITYA